MLNEDIEQITTQLGLKPEDNAVIIIDAVPGGRNVFIVLDTARGTWRSFILLPEKGRLTINEGTLTPAT